jgi:hypothetical protein
MSEKDKPADHLMAESKEALTALRSIWHAKGQTSAELDEACGNTTSCKNMDAVGFQGLADGETPSTPNAPVGSNLRAAWRSKLEREGKLNTSGGSVRDLVFGSSESKE